MGLILSTGLLINSDSLVYHRYINTRGDPKGVSALGAPFFFY